MPRRRPITILPLQRLVHDEPETVADGWTVVSATVDATVPLSVKHRRLLARGTREMHVTCFKGVQPRWPCYAALQVNGAWLPIPCRTEKRDLADDGADAPVPVPASLLTDSPDVRVLLLAFDSREFTLSVELV